VHRYFIQPRKQLKNVVAGILGITTVEVSVYFKTLGFKDMVRAQELTVEDWITLYNNPFK